MQSTSLVRAANDVFRMDYLDMAKGFGIILVVLGHHLTVSEAFTVWIYSFHMPLFFILSGWLYAHKKNALSFGEFVKKKSRSLLYPYVVFSILILLWKYLLYFLLGSTPEKGFPEIWIKSVTTYGYHALWFLPTLFFTEIIVHRLETSVGVCAKRVAYLSCILLGLGASELLRIGTIQEIADYAVRYAGRIFVAVVFYKIGMLMKPHFHGMHRWRNLVFSIAALGVSLLLFPQNGLANLNSLRIGIFPIYMLLGISGSVAIILLCQWIGTCPPLSFWGRNSLFVMAVHMDFSIEIAYILIAQIGLHHPAIHPTVVAVVLELLILAFAIPVVNKYFRFLLTPNWRGAKGV